MNYSKNLKSKDIAMRVIVGWVIAAFIGGLVSTGVNYIIIRNSEKKQATVTQKEIKIFGAYDDQEFKEEISLDWKDAGTFHALDISLNADIQEFTHYLCKGYSIDYPFVLAIMQVESDFQTDIVSSSDDYGLMQINKNNHDWITETIGVTDYLDPYQNIRAGCYILRKLFEKYQKPSFVLMAYNMGETGAGRLWKQGVYSTDYTEKVLQCQKQFNDKLEGD